MGMLTNLVWILKKREYEAEMECERERDPGKVCWSQAHWYLSKDDESCNTVCTRYGGWCLGDERGKVNTTQRFNQIAKLLGINCSKGLDGNSGVDAPWVQDDGHCHYNNADSRSCSISYSGE